MQAVLRIDVIKPLLFRLGWEEIHLDVGKFAVGVLALGTIMLVLKYDRYRISTGVPIYLYSGQLTSSTKYQVLLSFHVTHNRMHSHIYD